jgi:hypothetical protein
MDVVEEWLRDKASDPAPDDDPGADPSMVNLARNILNALADEWHDKPPVALLPYLGGQDTALNEFLASVDGPTMIGFDPTIYPTCVRCHQAWMLRRVKGVWAWYPDCAHKTAGLKLIQVPCAT